MHHTDTTQFKESLKYYTTRPDEMLKMYDQVIARLDSLQKAKAKVIKPVVAKPSDKNTLQLADSIKKAQAKIDSVKKAEANKKKMDSLRSMKFKLIMGTDINIKAQKMRDSIRKAKRQHRRILKIIEKKPDAVPDK
jgi:hypothetical protein